MIYGDGPQRLGRMLPLWVLTGVLTSVLAWRAVVASERHGMVEAFRDHAEERATVFEWTLQRHARLVDGVVALFAASREVEASEFDAFVARLLADHPAVEGIAWARREPSSGPRAEALVVTYDEGATESPLRTGLDLLANDAVCARACNRTELPDTLAFRWEADGTAEDETPRLVVLSPFYATAAVEGRRGNDRLLGVVALALRIDRIYEEAVRHLTPRGTQLYLYDESAESDRDLVLHHPPRLADGSNIPLPKARVLAQQVQYRAYVGIGGTRLRFVVVPTAGALAEPMSPERWIMLFGGLLLTALGARHLVLIDDRTKQMQESLARYRAVSETATNAILFLGGDAKILELNAATERLYGHPRERVVGTSYVERFLSPASHVHARAELDAALRTDAPRRFEAPCLMHGGGERLVSWSASRVAGANGRTLGLVLVGEDVTETRIAQDEKSRLQAQVVEGQKMEAIGVLAGGIAHDFNNVLAAMIGYTELAIGKVSGNAAVRHDLEEVLDACRHAAKLVRQILAFSRKSKSVVAPIDMKRVVDDAVELLQSSLPAMIKVRSRVDVDSAVILADESEMDQVVMNLCTNAYQAIGETEGVVTVSLDSVTIHSVAEQQRFGLERGTYVRLRVEDSGCGMDEKTRQRMFEPFFTTKGIGDGTGMGLAVVHGIVAKCKGSIRVQSEAGCGTTIEVYLPSLDERVDAGEQAHVSATVGGSVHVLLVDDEPRLVDMGRQMLEALGHRVTTATGSLEALLAFRKSPQSFGLVITDQSMPEMSGVELLQKLLEIRPDVRVVIATGYSKAVTPENARSLGFCGYISKPYLLQDLARALDQTLGSSPVGAA